MVQKLYNKYSPQNALRSWRVYIYFHYNNNKERMVIFFGRKQITCIHFAFILLLVLHSSYY
jgi:hypothetical protein